MCCCHVMLLCWDGFSCWLYLISSGLMNAGPVWDLLLLGASFWWVYVLDLVHPVDGLLALVYPSMCIYFLNNVPSTFCSNAMKWILLYDCYFWTVGCAFLSVLLLHDYSTILNAPGLLTDNSCLPPGLVMIPVLLPPSGSLVMCILWGLIV